MRTKILIAVLVGLATLSASSCSQPDDGKPLTVVSFGGAYQEAQRAAYMKPFTASTKTAIVEGEYDGDYGLLHQRATAPVASWDVVSVESGPALRGELEGVFLPIPKRVSTGLPLVEGAQRRDSIGHLIFSTILAYRSDSLEPRPTSWADFWDIQKFPGQRGLRNNPRGTLEIALLADGVAPANLYPLDVERALKKLDQIKPNIVFWDSGAQPLQLLANKTVTMTSLYNGRAWAAHAKEGLPISWSLNQGLLEFEFWAVPRNSKNAEKAFDFIRFSLERDQQASFANAIAYIPTNSEAQPLISKSIRDAVPDTSPAGGQINVDARWWAENEAVVSARWQRWKAGQ